MGKHDSAGGSEDSVDRLPTGPIVIRGIGRGVKDALRPGRTTRHRAVSLDRTDEGAAAVVVEESEPGERASTDEDASPPSSADAQTEPGPAEPLASGVDPHQTGAEHRQEERLMSDRPLEPGAPSDPDGTTTGPASSTLDPDRADVVRAAGADADPDPGDPTDEGAAELDETPDDAVDASDGDRDTAPEDGDARPADPSRSPGSIDPAAAAEPTDERDAVGELTALLVEAPPPRPAASRGPRPTRPAAPTTPHPAGAPSPRAAFPMLDRIGREAIGIAVLIVLALVCAGLIAAVVVKTRGDAAVAAREAAAYTPPSLGAPTPVPTGPSIAVIGDAGVVTAASGVGADERWPALLATDVSGTVSRFAAAGSGYTDGSADAPTFTEQASKVPADADVVVFSGGASDGSVSALSIARGATAAFAAARKQAPDAELLVIGPVIRSGLSTSDLTTVRSSLRSSAMIVNATWVDPIASRWLPADVRASASPEDLTTTDERIIAGKVAAAVRAALK